MGVAKSPEDHISNLTGVATFQPVETTIRVMRELFPQAKRMGIIWNPAEACSEACTYKARAESKAQGFELLEVNVSGTSEVMDALNLLLEKRIDLFLTSGDNTVVLALSTSPKDSARNVSPPSPIPSPMWRRARSSPWARTTPKWAGKRRAWPRK